MENTVNLPLPEGEDASGKLSELVTGPTVHGYRSPGVVSQARHAPTPPLGATTKASSRPHLTAAIAELVRLRQLAEAADRKLTP